MQSWDLPSSVQHRGIQLDVNKNYTEATSSRIKVYLTNCNHRTWAFVDKSEEFGKILSLCPAYDL